MSTPASTPSPSTRSAGFANSHPRRSTGWLLLWFLLAQVLLCGLIFREALWGQAVLAPLDIAPTLLAKFRYIDPQSSAIPANHYIADQLTYDLPIHLTIYQAYQRGEMPWWDPYLFSGRPLLADGRTNGTDPFRCLLYRCLPFPLAYNWTAVLHFVFTGLGMLLLLSALGFRPVHCLLLALTYEFCSCFALQFGDRWVQASFLYYPYLWLSWLKLIVERKWWCVLPASLLTALVFLTGNLQSNAYVFFFAGAFALGYMTVHPLSWIRTIFCLGITLAFGLLLAAPVLFNELEFFLIGSRKVDWVFPRLGYLGGLLSFSGLYPWLLGTFRTVDLSKLFGSIYPFGFSVFIGSACFVLALLGARYAPESAGGKQARRMSLWLCAIYFVIASTPLVRMFYMRIAPLAIMGLIVLAAFGLEGVRNRVQAFPRLGWTLLGLVGLLAVASNVFAWMVYPSLLPKLLAKIGAQPTGLLIQAPALREFQVRHLPAEISFQNPETVLACLSLLALAVLLLKPSLRSRPGLWVGLLILNLLPALLFFHRFVPHQPIAYWNALLAGGPEHQPVLRVLQDAPQRLCESDPRWENQLFPAAFPHLFRVHHVSGYSSLEVPNLGRMPVEEREKYKPQLADWVYNSTAPGHTSGELLPNPTPGQARFQWVNGSPRAFSVQQSGLNSIQLQFQPGAAGTLLWTDTYYPGWKVRMGERDIRLKPVPPCFSTIEIPTEAQVLKLVYEPRFLKLGIAACQLGGALLLLSVLIPSAFRRRAAAA